MGTRHVYHYHLDSLFHRGIISARKDINKVMRKLLAKYYNINYYCTYKLLFFILRRMINPLYWLSLSKWENSYIKRLVSFDKRQEAARMDKGTDVYISMLALNTPCIISLWMLCLVGFACTKIFRVNILAIIFGNEVLFISFLIVTGVLGYYINEIFLFKKDKYRKYFTEFEKKKRYLLYYGIYVVSTVMQVATFYLLLNNA